MLNYIVLSLEYACSTYNFIDYPENLSQIQGGLAIQITNKGMNKYLTKNIIFSGSYLEQSQINDIILNIFPFKIMFSDIKIHDYVLPSTNVFFKNNSSDFSLQNMSLNLQSQFSINQQAYPYFQDSGTAQFQIIGIDFGSNGNIYFDDNCPLHYFISITQPTITVSNLKIKLNGNLAVLYNSILQLITAQLQSQFNELLGPSIVNAIMNVANDALGNSKNYVMNNDLTIFLGFNQQPINGSIDEEFLTLHMVGQTMVNSDNPSSNPDTIITGYEDYNYTKTPTFVTNDHIQYKLHYLTIQSNIDKLLLKGFINQQSDEINVIEINTKGFTNTGLYSQMTIQIKEDTYQVDNVLKIEANPQFCASNSVNHTLIYVQNIKTLQASKHGKVINIDSTLNNKFNTVYDKIINAIKLYGIQITNSNGINFCNSLIIDSDWIHIGCILE